MPTIQFKGKNVIWNHHLSVPYHTLEEIEDLHFQPKKGDGNIIVEGDNLLALKALLPQYAGKVKCIYIDPPYNTGNDNGKGNGWVYNDNVNSPLIKTWLGKEVGSDDLTKHDKWLCMMTPRLKMLRDLLAEDGAIYISTDNIEYATLKVLMDEIFGATNFVGVLIWRKKEGGGQTDQFFATEHEYITVYRKSENFEWIDEEIEADDSEFSYEDDDGKYKTVKLAKWGNTSRKEDRPKMHFPIYDNFNNKYLPIAPDGNPGRWRVGKKRMAVLEKDKLIEFKENRNGDVIPYEKVYYDEDDLKVIKERSIIYELANTGDGTKALTKLFGTKDQFENPKPVELISWILNYNTKENDIILDSFAGSGTTMHAVNELNKEDGGNRKCILVQMTEESEQEPDKNIAKDITRERNKLAIEKYGYNSGFKYYRVGNAIDPEAMLEGELPAYTDFANYVYYLGTGEHLAAVDKIDQNTHFVGTHGPKNFYLIYEQDFDTLSRLALNLQIIEKIIEHSKGKRIVVYAPACFLDDEYLEEKQIEYVSIPYNLFEKSEE